MFANAPSTSGFPFSKIKKRAEQMEAEGPRTPVMHIEPRRLGIKQAYKKPVLPVSSTGRISHVLVKPKSSGGAADEFGR